MNKYNYRQSIDDNYEDALFTKLMDWHAQIEGNRLLDENESLKNDPNFYMPDGLDRRSMNTISSAFKAKKQEERHKKATTILKRIAMIVLICATLFTGLMCTASAFREAVFRLFTNDYEEKTDMKIFDSLGGTLDKVENNISIDEIPEDISLPTWLPEGYVLTSLSCEDGHTNAKYTSELGNQILYKELPDSFTYGIDTEDTDEIKSISINGYEGVFVSKGEKSSITWGDTASNKFIRISSETISEEEIIRIAESVEK